ncbi:MAG: hypothetical protein SGJ27_02970 [Candidatus Melainabacteria bacterium]|nr:hypothetical protein [Candidatus Melainabacteria bacterium]
MMNSQVQEISTRRTDTTSAVRLLTTTSLLVGAVFVLCGCTQQGDGSVFKVQSGEKTLLDIKKNPDEKVSIEVDVPKVNFKMKRDQDVTVERTTTTETTVVPPATTVEPVVPAPQPVPGVR